MGHSSNQTSRWVAIMSDSTRTGGLGPKPAPAPKGLLWRARLGRSVSSAPVRGCDLLFVTCLDGFLNAINARTGGHAWQFNAGSPIHSTSALSNNKDLFGC